MINKIKEYFIKDSDNHILWLPVFFAIGILLQFNFYEKYIILFFIILFLSIILFFKNKLFLAIFFLSAGYLRTYQYIQNNKHYIIQEPMGYVKVYGKVKEQIIKKNYNDKIINEIVVETYKIDKKEINMLLKIRLIDEDRKIYKSDIILNTVLFPIENNFMGFNSERYYYFQHIGGLGYKGKIIYNKKIDEKQSFKETINNIRTTVAKRIIETRPETAATGIIGILITGNKDLADKKAIEDMNYS